METAKTQSITLFIGMIIVLVFVCCILCSIIMLTMLYRNRKIILGKINTYNFEFVHSVLLEHTIKDESNVTFSC